MILSKIKRKIKDFKQKRAIEKISKEINKALYESAKKHHEDNDKIKGLWSGNKKKKWWW